MIRKVKNGMTTGGQFSLGILLSPVSAAVKLSESISLPKGGRGTAGRVGQVSGEQHMWKAGPHHRVEDNFGPVVWNEGAIFHDVARWHLHPAVSDHDPERRNRGTQRDLRG